MPRPGALARKNWLPGPRLVVARALESLRSCSCSGQEGRGESSSGKQWLHFAGAAVRNTPCLKAETHVRW